MKSTLRFSFLLFLFLTLFGKIIFATSPNFIALNPSFIEPQMCAFELGPIQLTDASGTPNDNTFCDGDGASINATFTMVGQVSTWAWTTDAPTYVTLNNTSSSYASITVQNPGITTRTARIQVVATDQNGCSQTKSIQITINPRFSITVTERDQSGTPNDKGICFGDQIEFRVQRSGGKPPFTYDWDHLPPSSYNTVTFNPIYDNSIHVYYVTVTDDNGCEAVGFESAKGFTEIIATQTAVAACLDDRNEFVVSGGVPSQSGYLFFELPSISATAITFSPASIPVYGQANGTSKTYNFRIKDEKGCFMDTQATLTTPSDNDNDGYRADCDCDDNDPISATNCSLSINCPSNSTVTAPVGSNSTTVNYNQPTGSSPCAAGGFSIQKISGLSSGASFPIGVSNVTFQANDNCSGQATCSFSITVNQGQSGGGGCTGNLLQNPSFESGGSWNGLVTTTSQSRTGFQSAEICGPNFNRIYSYANVHANQQYSFKVWTKTTGTGSNGITLKYFSSGWQVLQNEYQNLPNSSTWEEQTMTKVAPSGAAFVEVSIIRNSGSGCIYADDACFIATTGGNTGTLTISCPSDITETTEQGSGSKIINYTIPTASSTCQTGSVSLNRITGPESGSAFQVGTTTVSYEAIDGCGNIKTCSFTVTIQSGGSSGTCTGDILLNSDFENSTAWNGLILASSNTHGGTGAADICGPDFSRIFQYVAANSGQDYTLNFWAKETSAGSNGYTLKFFSNTWSILANEYKNINATSTWQEQSFTLAAPAGTAFVEVSFFRNGGTGCLNIDDVCLAPGSGGNGNLTLQCPDNQTLTTPIGQNTAIANYTEPSANSTCSVGSVSLNRTVGLGSGSAFPIGTNQVSYQATDGCGNVKTCSFTITVNASGGGNSDCDNISFSGAGGQISINNLPNKIITMQVFNKANYSHVFQCFNTNCSNTTQVIPNVAPGTYDVKIDIYEQNGGWQYVCQRRADVSVSANLVASQADLSLSAKAVGSKAILRWTANAMSDSDIFILERATNGANFEIINEVARHSSRGDFIYFEEVDDAPNTGLISYRIRQISEFYKERISEVQSLSFFDTKSVLIYPNPTSDWLNLDFGNDTNESVDINLIDRFGRVLFSQKMQSAEPQKIDLTTIQEGIYALSIEFENKRRVIKQVSVLR